MRYYLPHIITSFRLFFWYFYACARCIRIDTQHTHTCKNILLSRCYMCVFCMCAYEYSVECVLFKSFFEWIFFIVSVFFLNSSTLNKRQSLVFICILDLFFWLSRIFYAIWSIICYSSKYEYLNCKWYITLLNDSLKFNQDLFEGKKKFEDGSIKSYISLK